MSDHLNGGVPLSRIEDRPTHEEIAVLAYSIWEEEGKPDGHEIAAKNWLKAKFILTKHDPEPAANQSTQQQDLRAVKVQKKR